MMVQLEYRVVEWHDEVRLFVVLPVVGRSTDWFGCVGGAMSIVVTFEFFRFRDVLCYD